MHVLNSAFNSYISSLLETFERGINWVRHNLYLMLITNDKFNWNSINVHISKDHLLDAVHSLILNISTKHPKEHLVQMWSLKKKLEFFDITLSTYSLTCFSAASTGKFHCGFEEDTICMFTQDKTEEFDWTRHSAATRDTKYTPNTGPNSDRSGSKQGKCHSISNQIPTLNKDA